MTRPRVTGGLRGGHLVGERAHARLHPQPIGWAARLGRRARGSGLLELGIGEERRVGRLAGA